MAGSLSLTFSRQRLEKPPPLELGVAEPNSSGGLADWRVEAVDDLAREKSEGPMVGEEGEEEEEDGLDEG